ncbi:hypothetical protein NPIL_207441 [Nephila pilipes]|uniref:Uncharacterized protein n=1 Tax=Nephila pilipes TaxID=299642 RepID=A0A8X6QYS1_NEPPI|nr:hypothetical protein NPIL_207441 [Nephila pilipes]
MRKQGEVGKQFEGILNIVIRAPFHGPFVTSVLPMIHWDTPQGYKALSESSEPRPKTTFARTNEGIPHLALKIGGSPLSREAAPQKNTLWLFEDPEIHKLYSRAVRKKVKRTIKGGRRNINLKNHKLIYSYRETTRNDSLSEKVQ